MGRSNGYRPKKAVREEVMQLRARLNSLRDSEWVQAGLIMQRITSLLGHSNGPSNGRIEPRACRYCRYYGHTRQWCPARKEDEEAALQRAFEQAQKEDAEIEAKISIPPPRAKISKQEAFFIEYGIPYMIDPVLGPVLAHGVPYRIDL